MKLCATSFDPAFEPTARATWPLPEPALAYFPNARSATSDRDLVARVTQHRRCEGAAMPDNHNPDHHTPDHHGHVPVLIDRCVELLTPALTRHDATGAG